MVRNPVERTSRTSTITAKITTSLPWSRNIVDTASAMPMIIAATRAPQTAPRPPMTMTAKAITTICTSWPRLIAPRGTVMTPAMPANRAAMAITMVRRRRTSTPIAPSICGSSTVARISRPVRLRDSRYQR